MSLQFPCSLNLCHDSILRTTPSFIGLWDVCKSFEFHKKIDLEMNNW